MSTKQMAQKTSPKKSVPAKSVAEYVAAAPEGQRQALEKLRRAIRAAAPKAEEIISYRIPTYKHLGPLVHFVAREDYCSFIVTSRPVLETFKNELKPYDVSGTTIHFTPENPLPDALVKKIVKERIAENEKNEKSKKGKAK